MFSSDSLTIKSRRDEIKEEVKEVLDDVKGEVKQTGIETVFPPPLPVFEHIGWDINELEKLKSRVKDKLVAQQQQVIKQETKDEDNADNALGLTSTIESKESPRKDTKQQLSQLKKHSLYSKLDILRRRGYLDALPDDDNTLIQQLKCELEAVDELQKQLEELRAQTERKYFKKVSTDHLIIVSDEEKDSKLTPKILSSNLMHSTVFLNGVLAPIHEKTYTPYDANQWVRDQLEPIKNIVLKQSDTAVITFQEFYNFSHDKKAHGEKINLDDVQKVLGENWSIVPKSTPDYPKTKWMIKRIQMTEQAEEKLDSKKIADKDIDDDTIAITPSNGQFIASWKENGKTKTKSFPAKDNDRIISRLPGPGDVSHDTNLIENLQKTLNCYPHIQLVLKEPEDKDIEDNLIHVYPLAEPQDYWSKFKQFLRFQQPRNQYGYVYQFMGEIIRGQCSDSWNNKIRTGYFEAEKQDLLQTAIEGLKVTGPTVTLYNTDLYKLATPSVITPVVNLFVSGSDFDVVLLKPKHSKKLDSDLSDAIAVVNVHFKHKIDPSLIHEPHVKQIAKTIGKKYPQVQKIMFSGDFNIRRANIKPGFQPNVTNVYRNLNGEQQEDRTDIMLEATKVDDQWSITYRSTTTHHPKTGEPLDKNSVISSRLTPEQPHYFQPSFLSGNLPVFGIIPEKMETTVEEFGFTCKVRRSESQHVRTQFRLAFFGLSERLNEFFRSHISMVPETTDRGREIIPGNKDETGFFHCDPSDPLQRAQLLRFFFKVVGKNMTPYRRGEKFYHALWPLVILECAEVHLGKNFNEEMLAHFTQTFEREPLYYLNQMLKRNVIDDASLAYYAELIVFYIETQFKKKHLAPLDSTLSAIVLGCRPEVKDKIYQAACIRYPQQPDKVSFYKALKNSDSKSEQIDQKEKNNFEDSFQLWLRTAFVSILWMHRVNELIENSDKDNVKEKKENTKKFERQQLKCQRSFLAIINRGELEPFISEKDLETTKKVVEKEDGIMPPMFGDTRDFIGERIEQYLDKEFKERAKELTRINDVILEQFEHILNYLDPKEEPVKRALSAMLEIKSSQPKTPHEFIDQAARFANLISYVDQSKKDIPDLGKQNNPDYLQQDNIKKVGYTELDKQSLSGLFKNTSSLCKLYNQQTSFMRFYKNQNISRFITPTLPVLKKYFTLKARIALLKEEYQQKNMDHPAYRSCLRKTLALFREVQTIQELNALYEWFMNLTPKITSSQKVHYQYYLCQDYNHALLRLNYSELHFKNHPKAPSIKLDKEYYKVGIFASSNKKQKILANQQQLDAVLKQASMEIFIEQCANLKKQALSKRKSEDNNDSWHIISEFLSNFQAIGNQGLTDEEKDNCSFSITEYRSSVKEEFEKTLKKVAQKEFTGCFPGWGLVDLGKYTIDELVKDQVRVSPQFKELYKLYQSFLETVHLTSEEKPQPEEQAIRRSGNK